MNNWIRLCILALGVGHIVSTPVMAESSSSDEISETELQLQDRARKRLYPGGRDEEDLKVYESAVTAERKFNKRTVEKDVYKQLFNEDLALPDSPDGSGDEEPVVEE
jgi:hypothetical protein